MLKPVLRIKFSIFVALILKNIGFFRTHSLINEDQK